MDETASLNTMLATGNLREFISVNKLTNPSGAALMNREISLTIVAIFCSLVNSAVNAQHNETLTWTDPKTASKEFAGFPLMGEYVNGSNAIQVVPVQGRFYLSIYEGGLPGDGWNGGPINHEWLEPPAVLARLTSWKKVDRTENLDFTKPPEKATVLFDGKKGNHWAFGKVANGYLIAGAKTKRDDFTNFRLHLETRTPLRPELQLAHPHRGNSGIFMLGAYEVQICDTFGVDFAPDRWKTDRICKTPDTWCGAIYGLREANVNMCLPPLVWQTFDIDFMAARFEKGKKITNARMTVYQNGILIHDNVALKRGTGGGPNGPRPEVASGPIYLQSHGSPNQFRNIWIVERPEVAGSKNDHR